nr:hypothetical protein [uncultured Pseudodesulfovibrio sp.]
MSEVKDLEIIESEKSDSKQANVVDLAQTIVGNVAEQLATIPSNAGELVEAIEVTVEPVEIYKVTVRLPLR